MIHAVLAHRPEYTGVEPETELDRVLYACDEISGLIHAACLMRPTGIDDIKPKSVVKKLKDRAFAAGVDREQVARGVELIGLDRERAHPERHRRDAGGRGGPGDPGRGSRRRARESVQVPPVHSTEPSGSRRHSVQAGVHGYVLQSQPLGVWAASVLRSAAVLGAQHHIDSPESHPTPPHLIHDRLATVRLGIYIGLVHEGMACVLPESDRCPPPLGPGGCRTADRPGTGIPGGRGRPRGSIPGPRSSVTARRAAARGSVCRTPSWRLARTNPSKATPSPKIPTLTLRPPG